MECISLSCFSQHLDFMTWLFFERLIGYCYVNFFQNKDYSRLTQKWGKLKKGTISFSCSVWFSYQGYTPLDKAFSKQDYFYKIGENRLWIGWNHLFKSANDKSKLWCPLQSEEKCHFLHALLSLTFYNIEENKPKRWKNKATYHHVDNYCMLFNYF